MAAWWWEDEEDWEQSFLAAPSAAAAAATPAEQENFPAVRLPVRFEILIGGTWQDVTVPYLAQGPDLVSSLTGQVYGRDTPQIKRGRADESGNVTASSLGFTVNNRQGIYSPRNFNSPYYGLFGENVQIRCYLPAQVALDMGDGTAGETGTPTPATAPATSQLMITGDIDIRFDADMNSWCERDLCSRYAVTGNQRSWALGVEYDGTLSLWTSPDGTQGTRIQHTSTEPIPTQPGRRAIRVTVDVDNGAGGHDVAFYTSDTISGSWTQLGATVTTTGTTSLYSAPSAPLELGGLLDGLNDQFLSGCGGRLYAFELRSGIGGTVVANPNFTTGTVGAGTFTDTVTAAANTFTIAAPAMILDRDYRFWGEASDLPPKWDPSGRDVWVPLGAQGILRRLNQRDRPLKSPMRRGVEALQLSQPTEYWPLEDASGSTSFASGLAGRLPIRWTGSPDVAASSDFVASGALPKLGSGVLVAPVTSYVPTNDLAVRFLLGSPAGGSANTASVISLSFTGTLARLEWRWSTTSGGSFSVTGYDADGVSVWTPTTTIGLNGTLKRLSFELEQQGPNIALTQWETDVGEEGAAGIGDSLSGYSFGRLTKIVFNGSGTLTDTVIGHVQVHTDAPDVTDLSSELTGWDGEAAGQRIKRLCREEGIAFEAIGNIGFSEGGLSFVPADSGVTRMGVQGQKTFLALVTECAEADMGMLYEPRRLFGLGYRSRLSLYNQTPAITIDYAANELARVPEPVGDDQQTTNAVTVTRTGGTSATAELSVGRMSTADPTTEGPQAGVGRYEESVTINVHSDDDLPDQAGFRVALGTVDEDRYPTIAVSRENRAVVANPTLSAAVKRAEAGDRIVITNPPSWMGPQEISQIIQGHTEQLGWFTHAFVFNTSPESGYRVGVVDGDGLIDTGGSEVRYEIDHAATSMSVRTTVGAALWTTDPADWPFDITVFGERMTVTAVSAATGNTQVFTVTRSVNGVVRGHRAGEPVTVADPIIIGL